MTKLEWCYILVFLLQHVVSIGLITKMLQRHNFTMALQSHWARAHPLSRIHDHLDASHSARLLWTGDQPDAETST